MNDRNEYILSFDIKDTYNLLNYCFDINVFIERKIHRNNINVYSYNVSFFIKTGML